MSKFEPAVNKLLALEGGYVNDPDDQGGATKYGISQRAYPNIDIKKLTRAQAVAIYRRDWWNKYGYERIANQAIATKVLILAVNVGPIPAHKLLQRALNDCRASASSVYGQPLLAVDGLFGPKTVEACNGMLVTLHTNTLVVMTLKLLAIEYYLGLNQPKFLAGWIRRALV